MKDMREFFFANYEFLEWLMLACRLIFPSDGKVDLPETSAKETAKDVGNVFERSALYTPALIVLLPLVYRIMPQLGALPRRFLCHSISSITPVIYCICSAHCFD